MTAPASILSLVRNHFEAAAIGICLLAIVAAIWGSNMNGRHTQATIDAQATTAAVLAARDSVTVSALRAIVPVKAQNDSLHAENAALKLANDSLSGEATKQLARATTVLKRLTVKADSVTITTDSGVTTFGVPHLLAATLAAQRVVMDSAFRAFEAARASDSTVIAGKDREIAGLTNQIALDSTVVLDYRKQLAAADSATDAATKLARPRFSAAQGAALGAIGTLGSLLILALVF